MSWYEKRLKNVTIRDTETEIEGKKVMMASCHNDIDEMYHVTNFDNLKKIVKSGFLKPSSGVMFSSSVSLSANPQHTYGSGNIKIVFRKRAVEKMLVPMLYYNNEQIKEKYGVSAYKYEEDMQRDMERKLGVYVPINEVRTKIGMTDRVYIEECEWFTEKPLPVNRETVKMIVYVIPHRPDISKIDLSCIRSSPHYSSPDIESMFDLEALRNDINLTRTFVESNGFDFGVDSCFPFIKYHYSGIVVNLTRENLNRLARGEMPVVEGSPSVEEKEENCKCD